MGYESTEVYSSIRSYWRKRQYQRLEGFPQSKKSVRVVKLGGVRGPTRRHWKLRPLLKLRLRSLSPIKLLARLRDTYINAMLVLTGLRRAPATLKGPDYLWEKRVPKARNVVSSRPSSDFDQRIALEIYKSLAGPREITAF